MFLLISVISLTLGIWIIFSWNIFIVILFLGNLCLSLLLARSCMLSPWLSSQVPIKSHHFIVINLWPYLWPYWTFQPKVNFPTWEIFCILHVIKEDLASITQQLSVQLSHVFNDSSVPFFCLLFWNSNYLYVSQWHVDPQLLDILFFFFHFFSFWLIVCTT